MKRIMGLTVAVVLLMVIPAIAQETFTLTTYYPAPFGVYQRLVTQTLGVGDNNNNNIIDGGDAPDPAAAGQAGNAWIDGRLGIGTTTLVGALTAFDATTQGAIHIAGQGDSSTYSGLYLDDNDTQFTNRNTWLISHKQDTGLFTQDDFHITRWINTNNGRLDFSIDSATGNIGIGSAGNPQAALDVDHGYILPPRHDNDPATADSKEGMIYYSTTAKQLRVFDGTVWKNVGGGVQMASNIFIGSGGWRTVVTGFRPKIVMLLPHGEGPQPHADNLIIKMDSWPSSGTFGTKSFGAYPGCGTCNWTAEYIKDAEGYDNPSCANPACNAYVGYGIHIRNDGFETNVNTSGRPHSWIAIGY